MKKRKQVPRWLKHLGKVKAELRGAIFPSSAEEGFRQCIALSGFALQLLQDGARGAQGRREGKRAVMPARRLLAHMSSSEARRLRVWRKDCDRFFHG